jgi:hypothetical protein
MFPFLWVPELPPASATRFSLLTTATGLLIWGAFSDERTCLSFTIADGPSQGSHSRVRVPRDSFETPPNLEGEAPIFISSRNMVARLYPQALGSFFVASYDSQGYGGGIRSRLRAGATTTERARLPLSCVISLPTKYRVHRAVP